ncbi:hypothetical protein ACFVXG_33455 [Kitasatospora sp. NPDC058162]|uniref:hypothetical protein n=1 Tax=Kitasatospora sp. NPDC058162 TaxID=3346362 RepID=UPI0036DEF5BF
MVQISLAWMYAGFWAQRHWQSTRSRPHDRLLLAVVATAAVIHADRRGLSARRRRRCCRQLAQLGDVAEQTLALPGRAGWSARAPLRSEARRIAVVFRSHQAPLAAAYNQQQVEPIVGSLVCALVHLANGDRRALLVSAPESVPARRWLWRAAVRLWPAVVLLVAAAALPTIPPLANQEAMAASLRWTLLVGGVLALVAGQDVTARVGAALDKAMPWK